MNSCSKDEPGTYDLIGKPNPFMFELLKEEHNIPENSRSVMIGDRPNTDIHFGKSVGIDQCLVLSGVVTSLDDLEENWLTQSQANYDPTYIMDMIGTFEKASETE